MNTAAEQLTGARAMLTDLYELTMAYGYWKIGRADDEAVFHLHYRNQPFNGGFTIACGLVDAIRYLREFSFEPSDLDYLSRLEGNDGKNIFDPAFLQYLGKLRLRLDVDAIEEGTVVFPHEPLIRVTGPILQAQLVEPALLNFFNFQSLIATKTARVCLAARGDPVIEFGLRRAQGIDGAMTASRAAYIGGCIGTSNTLAGKAFNIPIRGTHAHSWVMFFENEREAFDTYADVMPNNCVFLIDTYDSLQGIRNAIEAGKRLRAKNHEMIGIRLDSGDLAWLSIQARKMLDAAGFKNAVIMASNNLDEHLIASLKQQGATINVWGVGTRLVTAYDQPALGGIYKLAALKRRDGTWEPRIKISDQAAKTSTPGVLQVRRFRKGDEFIGDAIYDETIPLSANVTVVDPADPTRRKHFSAQMKYEDLLVPIMRHEKLVYDIPSLEATRTRALEQLAALHPGIKRFENPHQYPAGLESGLQRRKTDLILRVKGEV